LRRVEVLMITTTPRQSLKRLRLARLPHAEHNNNVDEEYRYWAEASDCGESDRDVREVSPLNIGMIGLVAPAVEGDTEVKKFDCNNPDDTMSPL
jgi:hypothetical protein